MATFRERRLQSGKLSITAQIKRKTPDFYDSKSGFTTMKDAEKWAKKREAQIDEQISAGLKPTKRSSRSRTLGDAIDRYIAEDRRGMGNTKQQVLETIRNEYDIAKMPCDRITSEDISNFANELWKRPMVNSPATVNNYLQHLSGIFTVARPLWGFDLDDRAMKDAMKALGTLGVRGRPKERDRRPTLHELDLLMEHFATQSAHDSRSAPMHIIVAFAIFSSRRLGEICGIKWRDYEPSEKPNETRVLVRDLKHPGDKKGNDTWCTLPDPCKDIIDALPAPLKDTQRIFPYHSDTISRRFTNACRFLEIDDLRFHDLRHESTSRLFEMDWNIPHVARVTGHRSWESLKRYEHIRSKGDKYDNWKWIDAVT